MLAQLEPRRRRGDWSARRWIVAVALVVLAALAATLAIPDARAALFRLLSIGGERIELVDELPEIPVQDDLELALGERVTLEEARRASAFPLRELESAPDRVYVGDRGTVWFLYGSPERAAAPRRAVVPASAGRQEILLKKLVAPETQVERSTCTVAGHLPERRDAFRVPARRVRRARRGQRSSRPRRPDLGGGGVGYRLEGDFELEEARLAEALRYLCARRPTRPPRALSPSGRVASLLAMPAAPVRELDLDLDAFEGPFDLLLTLLLREELEPGEVDVAAIVLAFVEHLAERDEIDLEACGEFLVLVSACSS